MAHQTYPSKYTPGNGQAVFVDGVRTPFVKSFGVFQDADALFLYSRVVDALLRRLALDNRLIDEISCGVVIPQLKNANVARDTIINLGLDPSIHGYTLNRACTSSMHAIADAAKSIRFGHSGLYLAGGVECLSDPPIAYSSKARKFLLALNRARSLKARLEVIKTFSPSAWLPQPPALAEPLTGLTMGEHAEIMAKLNEIPRDDQDRFALSSHQKAHAAQQSRRFDEELVPVWAPPRLQDAVASDNLVRGDTTVETLGKLPPVFDRRHGSLTAGNSSPLTDGAAVCLIGDEGVCRDLGLQPKTRIVDYTFVGVDPKEQLLIGPALAIPLLLAKAKLTLEEIDLFEIHEAFAAQVLSCLKSMESKDFNFRYFGKSTAFGSIPAEKLNVNGGAIAIGHPFGATGARLVTTLSRELVRRKAKRGLIAICAAGGMAGAMLIENCEL